jgi:hypothetical protein
VFDEDCRRERVAVVNFEMDHGSGDCGGNFEVYAA